MSIFGDIFQGVASIIGANAADEEMDKAIGLINDSISRIDQLQVPDVTKRIIYQKYMSQGNLNPEILDKTIEEYAPVALLTEDPKNREAQMETYNQLKQTSRTGLSAQSKLGFEIARRKAAQDAMANMATIGSEFKRKGMGGAGMEIALKADAAQKAADRQALENLDVAAKAEDARTKALSNMSNLGSTIREQDLSTAKSNVEARRLRDQQLMQNAVARNQWNAQNRYATNLRNLNLEQELSNRSIGDENTERLRMGYYAPMQMYNMNLNKLGARNALTGNIANIYMGKGKNKAEMWNQIGSAGNDILSGADFKSMFGSGGGGGGGGGGSGGGGWQSNPLGVDTSFTSSLNPADFMVPSDVRLKENIEHIGNDNKTGLPVYDFNYKGHSDRYRGVIAQDVEQVMPDAVATRDGLKYVDYNKLGMKMFKLT